MHVERLGSGPRLVLVHGSVAPGGLTWNAQKPLADRFELVLPIRSGYPPNPPIASLAVVEPPAFGVARGDPAVEEYLALFAGGAPKEPRAYLEFFLPLVGSSLALRVPLPPAIEAGARAAIAERSPDQATIPLDEVAAAPFPKLVVSGGHHAAFDAVCDVLQERLGAQRAVLPGAGHSVPRLGEPFNTLLEAFVRRSDAGEQPLRGGGSWGSPA